MHFNLNIDLGWKKTIFNNIINLSIKFKLFFYTGQLLLSKLPQAVIGIVNITLITK